MQLKVGVGATKESVIIEQTYLAGPASRGMTQLFNTLSALLASDARKINNPFFASGLVAE